MDTSLESGLGRESDRFCFEMFTTGALIDHANTLIQEAHQLLSADMVHSVLSGIMLGDALGLPVETLSREEIHNRFGRVTCFLDPAHNKFITKEEKLSLGITSDDLQLTLSGIKATSLFLDDGSFFDMEAVSAEFVNSFNESDLGWGGATRNGVLALKAGMDWKELVGQDYIHSRDTGNGVPMKVAGFALFAAATKMDAAVLIEGIKNVALLTHRSAAGVGAGIVHTFALLYCMGKGEAAFSHDDFISNLLQFSSYGEELYPTDYNQKELTQKLELLLDSKNWDTFKAEAHYNGGSSKVLDSLPFTYAHFLGAKERNYQLIEDLVNAGGDTDSTAAMAGALLGALSPSLSLPKDLIEQVPARAEMVEIANQFCLAHGLEQ